MLERLNTAPPARKDIRSSHSNHYVLYRSHREEMTLVIDAADVLLTIWTSHFLIRNHFSYLVCPFRIELQNGFQKIFLAYVISYMTFVNDDLTCAPGVGRSVRQLLLSKGTCKSLTHATKINGRRGQSVVRSPLLFSLKNPNDLEGLAAVSSWRLAISQQDVVVTSPELRAGRVSSSTQHRSGRMTMLWWPTPRAQTFQGYCEYKTTKKVLKPSEKTFSKKGVKGTNESWYLSNRAHKKFYDSMNKISPDDAKRKTVLEWTLNKACTESSSILLCFEFHCDLGK